MTYEYLLHISTRDIGPLVAIGLPNERLPPIGSARIYVREEWQRIVAQLVADSIAVFLRIGSTEGFLWELRHLVENSNPTKVIICLPKRGRRSAYSQLQQYAREILPRPLPDSIGDAMFLTFDKEWTPRLLYHHRTTLAQRIKDLWRSLIVSYAPKMRDALSGAPAGQTTRAIYGINSSGISLLGTICLVGYYSLFTHTVIFDGRRAYIYTLD